MPKYHLAGNDLFVHSSGNASGPPVIFTHSSGLNALQWLPLIKALDPDFSCHAVDMIGCGHSAPLPVEKRVSVEDEVAVLVDLIDKIGQSVHLVGHSYGGYVALKAALKRPDALLSLAVFEPVCFWVLDAVNAVDLMDDFMPFENIPTFLDLSNRDASDWIIDFINMWNGPEGWQNLPDLQKKVFLKTAHKTYCDAVSVMTDRTPLSTYQNLHMPILTMSGATSAKPAQKVAEALGTHLPNARHVSFPKDGHMAPVTNAKGVNAEIVAFLKSIDQ